jgi:hypothetical protein
MEKFVRGLLRDVCGSGWRVSVALCGDDFEPELITQCSET